MVLPVVPGVDLGVELVTASATIPHGEGGNVQITPPEGKTIVGAGYDIQGGLDFHIDSFTPLMTTGVDGDPGPFGWMLQGTNQEASASCDIAIFGIAINY